MDDVDYITFDIVYQAVCVINPSAPVSAEIMLERFWIANAGILVPLDIFDEQIDAFQDFPVLVLPVAVVLPGIIRP